MKLYDRKQVRHYGNTSHAPTTGAHQFMQHFNQNRIISDSGLMRDAMADTGAMSGVGGCLPLHQVSTMNILEELSGAWIFRHCRSAAGGHPCIAFQGSCFSRVEELHEENDNDQLCYRGDMFGQKSHGLGLGSAAELMRVTRLKVEVGRMQGGMSCIYGCNIPSLNSEAKSLTENMQHGLLVRVSGPTVSIIQ